MTMFADSVGWAGAVLTLIAYGLVSTRRVAGDSLSYQSLNIAGAVGLTINTAYHGAFPSAVVNVAWIGIALYSIRRVFSRGFAR